MGGGYWPEVKGVKLDTDWQSHPPQLVWRHEIGAGWSSFAIVGNYAFTQEQRGDEELVSCYKLDTGEPVWTHADAARFDPADFQGGLGGIGPRATPTIVDGKVYTQGGTGIVNCLDARTGRVLWSHDTIKETGAAVTIWGKSGSPLVVDGMVIVSVGAPADLELREKYDSSLVAYDAETGKVRWAAGNRAGELCIGGRCHARGRAADSDGERELGDGSSGERRQGAVGTSMGQRKRYVGLVCAADSARPSDRVLLCKGYGIGVSLLQVVRDGDDKFTAKPVWEPPINPVMKSKFANLALRDGYAYGLDEVMVECVDIESGKIAWKKRRHPEFGHGQVMLIGDTLLVLSETGELALVEATPEQYHELASIQALDPADITWNNPAFSAPYLLVRNAHEAACYRLPLVSEAQ